MPKYRVVALPDGGAETVVTVKRRYHVNTVGKVAMLSVPTAEMQRLWRECNGNMEVVLGPLREALNSAGYTDLFILPAQTKVVELAPSEDEDNIPVDKLLAYYRDRLTNLSKHAKAVVDAQTATNHELAIAISRLTAVIAQVEVETWETS